jgi:hypothetical protein
VPLPHGHVSAVCRSPPLPPTGPRHRALHAAALTLVNLTLPKVTSLALPLSGRVEREGSGDGWKLSLPFKPMMMSVPNAQQLCAAFDRPGLPCGLVGEVGLTCTPSAGGGPGALGAYLGQCAEVAGRLRVGRTGGVRLYLEMKGLGGAGRPGAGGGGPGRGGRGGAGQGGAGQGGAVGSVENGRWTAMHTLEDGFPWMPRTWRPWRGWPPHGSAASGCCHQRAVWVSWSRRLHPRVVEPPLHPRAGRRGAGAGPAAAGRRRGAPGRPVDFCWVPNPRSQSRD